MLTAGVLAGGWATEGGVAAALGGGPPERRHPAREAGALQGRRSLAAAPRPCLPRIPAAVPGPLRCRG
jgi:hypothetical protein